MTDRDSGEDRVERIWSCQIGGKASRFPGDADLPMRDAVFDAFRKITGEEAEFCFSGWGASLTGVERAVVNDDDEAALAAAERESQPTGRSTAVADARSDESERAPGEKQTLDMDLTAEQWLSRHGEAGLDSLRKALAAEESSRAMFVARLENRADGNGNPFMTADGVLALLNDCDMLAQREGQECARAALEGQQSPEPPSFEQWAKTRGYQLGTAGGGYVSPATAGAWDGWQARGRRPGHNKGKKVQPNGSLAGQSQSERAEPFGYHYAAEGFTDAWSKTRLLGRFPMAGNPVETVLYASLHPEPSTQAEEARDAARYRWLHNSDNFKDGGLIVGSAGGEDVLWDEVLDRVIDAAMAEEEGKHG